MSWEGRNFPDPKYVKQIYRFLLLCDFALDNAGSEILKVLH